MSETQWRLKSLEAFLNIEWTICDGKNCCMGINVSSYDDRTPCEICKGTGHIHKHKEVAKNG